MSTDRFMTTIMFVTETDFVERISHNATVMESQHQPEDLIEMLKDLIDTILDEVNEPADPAYERELVKDW